MVKTRNHVILNCIICLVEDIDDMVWKISLEWNKKLPLQPRDDRQ